MVDLHSAVSFAHSFTCFHLGPADAVIPRAVTMRPSSGPGDQGMPTEGAQKHIRKVRWLAVFPGLAIYVVVFGVNLLGDALRDTLDHRLRGR